MSRATGLSLTAPRFRPARHRLVVLLTIVLACVITFFTLTPVTMPPGPAGSDKLHHFVAFAALSFPCALLFPRALVIVLPASILLGGGIELIQPFVGREGEWMDFVADAGGVVIGLVSGLALRWVLKRGLC